jgi:Pentapeptide repeats (8 copies)
MTERNDALIQTASGLWIPRQTRVQKNQRASQETQQDWEAHWKAQGQSWRREPEIDQERQQFLRQRLEIEIDEAQHIHPFQDIVLKRNDLEWLIQKRKEKSVGDEEQPQELNLQKAIFGTIDCKGLPLEGANFWSAKLEGANFWSARIADASFINAIVVTTPGYWSNGGGCDWMG